MTLTEIARLLHRLADTQANLPVPLVANEREACRAAARLIESLRGWAHYVSGCPLEEI